jgi:uncharacterized protein YxjI
MKGNKMKLYIKQEVFTWADRFYVYDAGENVLFSAEGEIFSWGKKLHVYDARGGETAYIEQQLLTFLPRYNIYIHGGSVAQIKREFTFFSPLYTVEGPGWRVEGDFLAHDYQITCNGRVVAVMHKEWLTWGDCYEIDVFSDRDVVMALCVILAIDCIMAQSK